jgi:DNA replication protein DnaC
MLNQPTLEKLQTLHLHGMAEAFRGQTQQTGLAELSFEERLAMLVDQEWIWRQNRALARRLSQAKFRYRASVEDIDFRLARGLDRSLVRSLTQNSAWVHQHQHVFLLGPCGVGKTWLACALAEKACRDGFTAFFRRAPQLFRDLALARRQSEQLSGSVGQDRRAGGRRLGQFALGGNGASRLPGDLRRSLPAALDDSHQPDPRQPLARANRRPHPGRQHSRPTCP